MEDKKSILGEIGSVGVDVETRNNIELKFDTKNILLTGLVLVSLGILFIAVKKHI